MEFLVADSQVKALLEHHLKVLETDSVDNVLVHCPTFQRMKMLITPFVPRRQEQPFAFDALMFCCGTFYHSPRHPASGDPKIEGCLYVHPVLKPGHVPA